MKTQLLDLDTSGQKFTDLTDFVGDFVAGEGDGLCNVFVPHATAGLALFELHAGSDADLDEVLGRLLPRDNHWVHQHGSPGHGADHVLPAFISPSLSIPRHWRPSCSGHLAIRRDGRSQSRQSSSQCTTVASRRLGVSQFLAGCRRQFLKID